MFQLFGILPLVKILTGVFLFISFSQLLGALITRSKTSNAATQLVIGLVFVLGIAALVINKGITVFLPALLAIVLIFKLKFTVALNDIRQALKNTIIFVGIFTFFFVVEVFKQDYFSKEIVNSSWGDFSYYVLMAREMFQHGVEGTQVYLNDYRVETSPNIYHYFDLYLLLPGYLLHLPPLLNFLLFFIPISYSLATYLLVHLFGNKASLIKVLFAIIAVNYIGFNYESSEGVTRISFIDFYKSVFLLVPFLLFGLRKNMSNADLLILICTVALVLNPIILLLIIVPFLMYFLMSMKSIKKGVQDVFKIQNLVILCAFLFYLSQILSPETDNSYMLTDWSSISFSELLAEIAFELKRQLSILKFLPQFLLFCLISILMYKKDRTSLNQQVLMTFVVFVFGILFTGLFYKHYDGSQFFVISLITVISVSLYYSLLGIVRSGNLLIKALGYGSLALYFLGFCFGGYSIFVTPKGFEATSISFVQSIEEEIGKERRINALYFPEIKEEDKWIYSIPYLPFDVGYLQYFENANCIKPISVSFFEDNESYPPSAINSIKKAPFQRLCASNNLAPKNYYDSDFETAIVQFIETHSINTVIFDKHLEIPNWLDQLQIHSKVLPVEEYDNQIVYFID